MPAKVQPAVAMPIKKVEIRFDKIGYPGWVCEMRTNPRSYIYDEFINEDPKVAWSGFSKMMLSWNFGDEEGNELPLPDGEKGTQRNDLPPDVINYIYAQFYNEFSKSITIPKGNNSDSKDTSTTGS